MYDVLYIYNSLFYMHVCIFVYLIYTYLSVYIIYRSYNVYKIYILYTHTQTHIYSLLHFPNAVYLKETGYIDLTLQFVSW